MPFAVGGRDEDRSASAADHLGRAAVSGGRSGLARCAAAGEARCGGFAKTFPCDGSDAVYFYTRDVPADEKPCDLQARMFHPGASGLSEDPATGSATVAAAALLADLDPSATVN